MSSFFLFSRVKHCQLHARALFGTACNLSLVLTQQTGLLECGSFTNYCYKKDLYWQCWSFIKRAIWKGIGRHHLPPPFLKGYTVALGARGLLKHLTEEEGGRKFGSGVFAKNKNFRSCFKGDTSLSAFILHANISSHIHDVLWFWFLILCIALE